MTKPKSRYIKKTKEDKLNEQLKKNPDYLPSGHVRISDNNGKGYYLNAI